VQAVLSTQSVALQAPVQRHEEERRLLRWKLETLPDLTGALRRSGQLCRRPPMILIKGRSVSASPSGKKVTSRLQRSCLEACGWSSHCKTRLTEIVVAIQS
jgi:hypothetical protein